MAEELGILQSKMHKDFFDRAKDAINNGFYLEAIFLEYAAMEGRLEVILGLLGLPCNKDLPFSVRKEIKISNRIRCINKFRKQSTAVFEKSKLEENFFSDKGRLSKWIRDRNTFVHGLYKNAEEYKYRNDKCEELAMKGMELAGLLYGEAKRLRYMKTHHEENLQMECRCCQNKKCAASTIKE